METTRPTQVTTGGQMPYSFGLDVSFELHEQQKCRRFMRNCSKSAARIGATSRRRWREDNPPSLLSRVVYSRRRRRPSRPPSSSRHTDPLSNDRVSVTFVARTLGPWHRAYANTNTAVEDYQLNSAYSRSRPFELCCHPQSLILFIIRCHPG